MVSCLPYLIFLINGGDRFLLQTSSDNSYSNGILSPLLPSSFPCQEWQEGEHLLLLMIYDLCSVAYITCSFDNWNNNSSLLILYMTSLWGDSFYFWSSFFMCVFIQSIIFFAMLLRWLTSFFGCGLWMFKAEFQ